MTAKRILAILCCCVALARGATPTPPSVLWERWLAYAAGSLQQVDHSGWERFLTRYMRIGPDGVHRIAYGNVSAADKAGLDAYLRALSKVEIEAYDRPEQMAFWINLYNAMLVRMVIEHYPIASIHNVAAKKTNIAGKKHATSWDLKLGEVQGVRLSLNDIEHRILRPIWQDPRVHYALSCAAVDCPNLQPEPYVGARVEQQLSHAAMAYINDPRRVAIAGGKLRVSSLWRWSRDDFGGSDLGIIHHLMGYAKPALAMALQRFDKIDGDGFDWRLNDATR